jgi:hypothetical protein
MAENEEREMNKRFSMAIGDKSNPKSGHINRSSLKRISA